MKLLLTRKQAARNTTTEVTSDQDCSCQGQLQGAVKSTISLVRDGLIIFGLLCAVFEIAWDNTQLDLFGYKSTGEINRMIAISENQTSTSRKSNRYKIGSWIGDTWVPPQGWRIYSHQEIQHILGNKSIMFIGDSTSRRGAGTMYSLLAHDPSSEQAPYEEEKIAAEVVGNGEIEQFINLNKGGSRTEPCVLHGWDEATTVNYPDMCRPVPNTTSAHQTEPKDFVVMRAPCFKDIEDFLLAELEGRATILETAQTELLVIAAGIWESARPGDCRDSSRTREKVWEDTMAAVRRIQTQRPEMTIIWRTSGFHADMDQSPLIHALNNYFMDQLDAMANPKITYVHFGGAIEPKSYGRDRLVGDMNAHYGPIPRIVLAQMIVNAYVGLDS
jgi:hypothetical protein